MMDESFPTRVRASHRFRGRLTWSTISYVLRHRCVWDFSLLLVDFSLSSLYFLPCLIWGGGTSEIFLELSFSLLFTISIRRCWPFTISQIPTRFPRSGNFEMLSQEHSGLKYLHSVIYKPRYTCLSLISQVASFYTSNGVCYVAQKDQTDKCGLVQKLSSKRLPMLARMCPVYTQLYTKARLYTLYTSQI